ncbi:MAG: RNA pyrophosphohydrolase [Rhodospirillaceae bacterium]|nr:RNA pyrophosphohydrolase [Rhodospirillaceae bacterium]
MNKDKEINSDLPYRLGVGALILNANDDVFVAKRIDTPGPAWQMPQGGIDDGEDPAVAIFREVEEEIGTSKCKIIAQSNGWLTYDIPEDLREKLWGGKYRGQKQKWYAMRFLGDDSDIVLDAHHKPEFSEWRWVEMKQVPNLIVPFKRELYNKIVDEFSNIVSKDNS